MSRSFSRFAPDLAKVCLGSYFRDKITNFKSVCINITEELYCSDRLTLQYFNDKKKDKIKFFVADVNRCELLPDKVLNEKVLKQTFNPFLIDLGKMVEIVLNGKKGIVVSRQRKLNGSKSYKIEFRVDDEDGTIYEPEIVDEIFLKIL